MVFRLTNLRFEGCAQCKYANCALGVYHDDPYGRTFVEKRVEGSLTSDPTIQF